MLYDRLEDQRMGEVPQISFHPHDGSPCPVAPRELVRVLHRDGEETSDYASEYIWVHLGRDFDVVGYRRLEEAKPTLH